MERICSDREQIIFVKVDQIHEGITKTRLFKYIENFTTKKGKFSDKNNSDIFILLLKTNR